MRKDRANSGAIAAVPLLRPRPRSTAVRRDNDGHIAGYQIEQWDDRVDAIVTNPVTVRYKASPEESKLLRQLFRQGVIS